MAGSRCECEWWVPKVQRKLSLIMKCSVDTELLVVLYGKRAPLRRKLRGQHELTRKAKLL